MYFNWNLAKDTSHQEKDTS